MRRWLLVGVLVLAGACSSGSKEAATTTTAGGSTTTAARTNLDTPAAVVAAFNAGGFECSGYKDDTQAERTEGQLGTDYSTASGSCTHAGKTVKIDTYTDSRHANAQIKEIDGLGCSIGKDYGVTEYNFAYGDTWVANWDDTLDREVPKQMAAAVGGKTHHYDCP